MSKEDGIHEKESIMWKIPLLGITVRHHSANLVMPNSYMYLRDPHLTTIKYSESRVSEGLTPPVAKPSMKYTHLKEGCLEYVEQLTTNKLLKRQQAKKITNIQLSW